MAKPVILYENLLREDATVITDPGTETGFALSDIYDYRSYTVWKSDDAVLTNDVDIDIDLGSAKSADYFMLVNHNLAGHVVYVYWGPASPPATGSSFVLVGAGETISSHLFTTGSYRYWRIRLVAAAGFSAKPYIGELFLGARLTLPQYMDPGFDPFFKQVEVQGARSRGGHYLGSSLRGQTHRGTITFGEAGAPRADFTSDLNAFLDDHAYKRLPFGFILDSADGDFDSTRYLKVPDESQILRQAVGNTWTNLTFSLPVEEAYSEAP
jgi:hypothetical protein